MEENNIDTSINNIDLEKIKLIEELKKKQEETEKFWDLFVRTKAEIENIKKRTEKDIANIQKHSLKIIFNDLLPFIDGFELYLKNINNKSDPTNEGYQLLYKLILSILEKHNVKKMEIEKYTELDPTKHEVISIIQNDQYNNVIDSIFQDGYMLHDQVLRYAKVSILKNEENLTIK